MERIIFIIFTAIMCFLFIELFLEQKLCKNILLKSEKIYIPIIAKVRTYFHYGIVAKDLEFDNLSSIRQKQIIVPIIKKNSEYGLDNFDPMVEVRVYESVWNHMKKIS